MRDPVAPEWYQRLRQSVLLGLNRQPVGLPPELPPAASGSDPMLTALALAGQRQRFAGPGNLAAEDVPDAARRLHADPRPVLPEPARRPLLHLKQNADDALVEIAIGRITAAGLRLHPFDMPALARQIKAHAERLGPSENAFLALIGAGNDDQTDPSLFFDEITRDNWTTFPKSRRRDFIAQMRRQDAGAGRALIEAVWKSEPAAVRASLLEALAAGLGPDDLPFLESLAADRAKTVKDLAGQLIARMPGTEAYAQRLAEAAACFSRKDGKLGRAMAAIGMGASGGLTFSLGGDAKNWQQQAERRSRLFDGIDLRALAQQVGSAPEALIDALPADSQHEIIEMFLDAALSCGDTALAGQIIAGRLAGAASLTGPLVTTLARRAPAPLDAVTARQVISSPAWTSAIGALAAAATPAAQRDDGRLAFMAALMPRAVMPAFVATLAPLALGTCRDARDFADLILALPD